MEHPNTSYLKSATKSLQQADHIAAEKFATLALHNDPKCAGALHILGIIRCMQSAFAEGEELLKRAATLSKTDSDIFFNLAKCLSSQDKDSSALKWHRKSIELNRNNPEAWLNYGISLAKVNKLSESLVAFDSAIKLSPNHAHAWFNKSAALLKLGELPAALECSARGIELAPNSIEAYKIHGAILARLGRQDDALTVYRSLLRLNPDEANIWLLQGNILQRMGRLEEALGCYSISVSIDHSLTEAHLNRGVVLHELQRYDEALESFYTARRLDSDSAAPSFAIGMVLGQRGSYAEALRSYDEALRLGPDFPAAWNNRGAVLNELGRFTEAIDSYIRALTLGINGDFLPGNLLDSKMKICDWSDFNSYREQIRMGLVNGERVVTPLTAIGLFDSSILQRSAAEIYSTYRLKNIVPLARLKSRATKERIRIGYFSMDFREHPVGHLIAELFELHDRNFFDVYGFSFGVDTGDALRRRIEASFDRFIDISNMSTREIGLLSQNLDIDIAIDLGGFTKNSRPEVFATRVAPIQINYLGFPGTMGSIHYDYIVADRTLIPTQYQSEFSEKVIYMPYCYQVNDRKRTLSDELDTRTVHSLPERGFVYCCFNNNWKLLPEIFDLWMEIAKRVEGSVFWFREDNPLFSQNLRGEAAKRGVDPKRLIFAGYMSYERHLSRYKLADLFLDTYPYNGHTTASDALWAGLPIITMEGETYASRVGSSLLRNLGLKELIVTTPEEYISLAVELSLNPFLLSDIKGKIAQNRTNGTLFDTPLFARHIETAFKIAYQGEQSGALVNHIYIEPEV
jgi:protein O-GlcNAc transferase